MTSNGSNGGWEITSDQLLHNYKTSWNGVANGQVYMGIDFNVKADPSRLGFKLADVDEQAITYAHYDGTAVDHSSVG